MMNGNSAEYLSLKRNLEVCVNNTADGCGDVNFAPCIRYEKELPDFTKIVKSCVNIEDTTDDIYSLIADIKQEIPANLISRLELLEEAVQELENTAQESICNKDITGCVDTTGLTDPCSNPIVNLGQLLNYIISQL